MDNASLKDLSIAAEYFAEVPFFDLDPMQIVWHGNYVKYFEEARCQLLRKIDYDYPDMKQSGYYWPIIDMRLKYVKPARYGDKLICIAVLKEFENRLKIEYQVQHAQSGEKLCKGYTAQVAVTVDTFEMQLISPPILKQKIEDYCEQL
ncbi:acyl-CoA thioesterase [Kangiella sediminilitoris]|uniref:Thioesterase n=1 Tax=Kangiella sediminilitoris TaxID=1144748 RepID=A0A1B3BDV3_9GAMM|nr:acyl-CoA thioesterase [Kangiella sediminilitoris]AOE50980.1 thioesterase [Kangiella sediminilitoris]